MGSQPPPGCWVPKQGPSPRPGRRMAQEAFEAYGESSPLPALPHLPIPPGYVPPRVSMGTGEGRHGTLSTLRRRGDYRQGAAAAGDPGVRSLYQGEGREGQKEETPPPHCSQVPRFVLASCFASCLQHACYGGKTTRAPPPPHTPPPSRVREEGGRKRGAESVPPRTRRQGGEAAERGCGTDHTTVPVGSSRCARPQGGDHRGCEQRVGRATRGATRQTPPPPAEGQVPRACTAAPQQKPEDRQQGRPLQPPLPHPPRTGARTARGQRGDMGGGAQGGPQRPGGRRAASGGDARARKKKGKAKQRTRVAKESRDGRAAAGARERGKERGKGGSPGDKSGEAGTNTAANGGGPG